MYKITGKIAFITGASSGIGKACAEQLAAQGVHLILTARRLERIQQLAQDLQRQFSVKTLAIQLDVRDAAAVETVVKQLPSEWQQIEILVNNAGGALTMDKMQDGKIANWDSMIDTNLKGLLYVTHAILPTMVARNAGHIVNIGSIAGHEYYPGGNVYCATKHAVKAINKSLQLDLLGTAIRVSSVDPGMVETEFSEVRLNDKARAKSVYAGMSPLTAGDIADAVVYCATRAPHVNVAEMQIFPTDQASVTHVHRRPQA